MMKSKYRYNVCNGLTNQLLHHASSIAYAVQQGQPVEIPNRYLVDGVQHTAKDVLPTKDNSMPLADIFNTTLLLERVKEFGIEATLVEPDFEKGHEPIECAGFGKLSEVDERVVLRLMQSFEPSGIAKVMVEEVLIAMQKKDLDLSQGVCVHHRDGDDWHSHCKRWSGIKDGIYRGNCLLEPQSTFLESLESRALTKKSRWVYYSGDHEIPSELVDSPYAAVSKDDFLSPATKAKLDAIQTTMGKTGVRDLWALVDFAVCSSMPYFVGNSVSTWSALQLALRDGYNAYWYNSQSIPLSTMWEAFQIPIVYTFTELSAPLGKYMLQTSITSVRKHMPYNQIHVLYHGDFKGEFRDWLAEHNVIIHNHRPLWRDHIEKMRQNGNPRLSHLFLHEGNYLGTWQRIDIPKFIHSEYVLLMDSDTVVKKPFTMADFGFDITRSIAFGPEYEPNSDRPFNAGVALLNIPTLRKTYRSFLKFILEHMDGSPYNNDAPSDQGAYLEFYEDKRFLGRDFNFKPYYRLKEGAFENAKVLHFHGPKPHQYIGNVFGIKCDAAAQFICDTDANNLLCKSEQEFAQNLVDAGTPVLQGYCNAAYQQEPYFADFCTSVMHSLADIPPRNCRDLGEVVQKAKISFDQEQNEKLIEALKRNEELAAKLAKHEDNEVVAAFDRSEAKNLAREQTQILAAAFRRNEELTAELPHTRANENMVESTVDRLGSWSTSPIHPQELIVVETVFLLILLVAILFRKRLIPLPYRVQVTLRPPRGNSSHGHTY